MCAPSWIGNAPWLSIFGICFHQQLPFPRRSACMKKHFRYIYPVEPSTSPGRSSGFTRKVLQREKKPSNHISQYFFLILFWNYRKIEMDTGNDGKFLQISAYVLLNTRSFHTLLFFKKVIVLFFATLGLCCLTQAFSSWASRGYSLVAVCGLLVAVASLVEHRL